MRRKAHAFAIDSPIGEKTYCGTPVTEKTVFALRSAYVSCKRCRNKSNKGVVTTTSNTTGEVIIVDPVYRTVT